MRVIRPFTTHVVNPIARRFASWLPGFGILEHRGRRSGRLNVFRRDDWYVFALTYGADVEWVKNVVAAGGCILRTRGRAVRLIEPEVFVDPRRRLMPLVVRIVLRFDRATEFLRMRIAVPPTARQEAGHDPRFDSPRIPRDNCMSSAVDRPECTCGGVACQTSGSSDRVRTYAATRRTWQRTW
jgi:hypothetical protein